MSLFFPCSRQILKLDESIRIIEEREVARWAGATVGGTTAMIAQDRIEFVDAETRAPVLDTERLQALKMKVCEGLEQRCHLAGVDWDEKQSDGCATLPQGTLKIYLTRGWCRLEVVAALCPKKYASGKWRPGPIGLRFRYHHDPDASGIGPIIKGSSLLDPLTGFYTNEEDKKHLVPVLEVIADRYQEYEDSGSRAWEKTFSVKTRPL